LSVYQRVSVWRRNLPFVVFPIDDLSQPFRRPSELRRLAEAVRDTDEYDEGRWIEWKSRLVLTDLPGKLHLVKQILGFANRDPQVAAQWCQGNAYLLVGVSPDEVHGVEAVDHQMLSQHLQPYLGTEVVWNPEYTEVDGHKVLVIEVGPPSPGDPIHFLMNDLFITRIVERECCPEKKTHGFNEGTIFVRRSGTTERANREERLMLLRRARSAETRLEVRVTPVRPTLEATPLLAEQLTSWAEEERQRLMAARYQPFTDTSRAQTPEGLLRSVMASALSAEADPRSWEQYQAQVEDYLTKMRTAVRDSIASTLEEHPPAQLALTLVNNSKRPFRGVVVTATLLGENAGESVRCLTPGEHVAGEFPDPPTPYGTPQHRPLVSTFIPPTFHRALQSLPIPWRTSWELQHDPEGIQIVFDAVDLRAHARIALEPVPLFVELPADSLLTVHWKAASLDTHGQDTGTFALTVIPSTLDLQQTLRLHTDDESDAFD
jgi:schlafen family protein